MFHIVDSHRTGVGYAGLRMSADEFLALPESDVRYELIDGVVLMSPSPSLAHQRIIAYLMLQIGKFLEQHPIGEVLDVIDVKLGQDIVYCPDVVFLCSEKSRQSIERIAVVPDLVIEVGSPSTRKADAKTKRADYEAAGVSEYWLIDPIAKSCTFLVLREGRYVEVQPAGDRYNSAVLAGFGLDLERIRARF